MSEDKKDITTEYELELLEKVNYLKLENAQFRLIIKELRAKVEMYERIIREGRHIISN